MLELIGLYKTFNPGTVNEKRAINGLNLTLEDGDFVTIIGGNGGVSKFLAVYASVMPDLMSLFLLAVIILISIKILDYAYRLVMFWIALAFKLVFWVSVLGLGWYVYNVGIENAGRGVGWVWGLICGFVGDFEEKTKMAAAAYAGVPR